MGKDLKGQLDLKEDAVIIRLDSPGSEVWTESAEGMNEWLKRRRGVPVAAGQLSFRHDNNEQMVPAYVPDPDGKVRPGYY